MTEVKIEFSRDEALFKTLTDSDGTLVMKVGNVQFATRSKFWRDAIATGKPTMGTALASTSEWQSLIDLTLHTPKAETRGRKPNPGRKVALLALLEADGQKPMKAIRHAATTLNKDQATIQQYKREAKAILTNSGATTTPWVFAEQRVVAFPILHTAARLPDGSVIFRGPIWREGWPDAYHQNQLNKLSGDLSGLPEDIGKIT